MRKKLLGFLGAAALALSLGASAFAESEKEAADAFAEVGEEPAGALAEGEEEPADEQEAHEKEEEEFTEYGAEGPKYSAALATKILKFVAKNGGSDGYIRDFDINADAKVSAKDASELLKIIVRSSGKNADISGNYSKKWAYNKLYSAEQRALYRSVYENAKRGVYYEEINVVNMRIKYNSDDVDLVRYAIYLDNGEVVESKMWFWLDALTMDDYVALYTIPRDRAEDGEKLKSEFEAEAYKLAKEAGKLSGEFEKALYIHDYLAKNTEYEGRPENAGQFITYHDFADGALVYKNGVCEAYAKAFVYMCQKAGLECVCVYGEASGGEHIWNKVKIDGEWYNVDVTWDSLGGGTVSRENFLRSDLFFAANHSPYKGIVKGFPKAPADNERALALINEEFAEGYPAA